MSFIEEIFKVSYFVRCLGLLASLVSPVVVAQCQEIFVDRNLKKQGLWLFSPGVEQKRDGGESYLHLSPEGLFGSGIRRDSKLGSIGDDKNILVAHAIVRGVGLLRGDENYKKGKLVIDYVLKNEKVRHETHLLGKFGWRNVYSIAVKPNNVRSINVRVRNEARKGSLDVREIGLSACNKKDISDLGYPKKWTNYLISHGTHNAKLQTENPSWAPLQQRVIGFQGAGQFETADYRKDLNSPQVAKLQPAILRFPPGITANFYHWKYDGLDPQDLSDFPAFSHPGRRASYAVFGKGKRRFGRDVLAQWSKQRAKGIALLLNVVTADKTEDQVEFVRYMLSQGAIIDLIEIGNELYWEEQRGNRLSTVTDYISKIRKLCKRLKARFPEIPVGIPISDVDRSWNEAIKKSGISFDAVVLHPYPVGSSIPTVGGDLDVARYAAEEVPALFKRTKEYFPEKRIWITEWNLLDRPYVKLGISPTGVLFDANMIISFLNEPRISGAMYHAIFADDLGLLIPAAIADSDTPVVRYPPLYSFWVQLARIVSSSKKGTKGELSSPDASGISDNQIRLYRLRNEQQEFWLLVNNGRDEFLLQTPWRKESKVEQWNWTMAAMTQEGNSCNSGCGSKADVSAAVIKASPASVAIIGPFPVEEGVVSRPRNLNLQKVR